MKVEIYGAEWCTSCKQAKQLCESKELDFEYIDIDELSNLRNLEERLGSRVRSVPQIFIDGNVVSNGITGLKEQISSS